MERVLNWKREPKDDRDYKFKDSFKVRRTLLPPVASVKYLIPEVWDQGGIGACTAFSTGMSVLYQSKVQTRPIDPSKLFLYYITREFEDSIDCDCGAYIRDVFKVLSKTGICKEQTWPYIESKFAIRPSDLSYKEAPETVGTIYHSLDNSRLEELKTCIAVLQKPFVFGFNVYSSFMSGNWDTTTGMMPIPNKRKEQLLGGHAVCLTPDNFIRTINGLKYISEITDKDKVLTRDGYKNVLNTSIREINEDIYLINSPITLKPISVTKEHPIFIQSSSKFFKLRSGKLENFEFKRADSLKKYDIVCSVIDNTIIDDKEISKDFARLLGYYIGDGNLQIEYYKGNIKSIKFRLSYHRECKKGIIEDLISIVEKEFPGTKYSIWESKDYLSNNIIFYNTDLGKKILKYCGKAKEKNIDSLLYLPLDKQMEIIYGWFKTDGNGEWLKQSSIHTSEYDLAQNLIFLLQRNKLIYSTTIIPPKATFIKNKPVKVKESYTIYFHTLRQKTRLVYRDNLLYSKISSISIINYAGNVYNLQIKDKEEYIANNILVHNCAIGFDDSKQAFEIKNSWSEQWGIKGNFWMPYSFITSQECDDFWVLESINDLKKPQPVDTALDITKVFTSRRELGMMPEYLIVRIGQLLTLPVDINFTKRKNIDIVANFLKLT